MHHRVGSLHLHYRIRDGALGALTPSLDRAIQSGLAEALDARMSVVLGDDASVVVIRELKAAVTLAGHDAMLDSRVVDRVCASSVDALVHSLVHADSSDALVRFADEAEFAGSFIVDLLAGYAWDHWYYGAFRPHRRATVAATIQEVLARSAEAARVLAWLARRGQLDRVLSLLNADELLPFVTGRARRLQEAEAFDGALPLADAAIQILAALGLRELTISREELLRQYSATAAVVANWSDRHSLSAQVFELVRFIARRTPAAQVGERALSDAVKSLLGGPLDWLDGPWLIASLAAEFRAPDAEPSDRTMAARSLLTPQQTRALRDLAARLREKNLRFTTDQRPAEIAISLIALANERLAPGEALDRALSAAIEDVVHIYVSAGRAADPAPAGTAEAGRSDADQRGSSAALTLTAAARPQALDRYGKAAAELLDAITGTRATPELPLIVTQAGGLFLLLRALMDMRVPALARQFEVPVAALLGALAVKWFDVVQPFDEAASLWAGTDRPDFGALDTAQDRLDELNEALLDTLTFRQGLDEHTARESIESDAILLSNQLSCSPASNAAIGRTASMLVRAWAYWLRGIADSSTPFLLDNCLRRAARVRICAERIDMDLDPSPLDVVLRMSGCFERIDGVPWLDNRRVTFTVRRAP